jgi:molybdenum storage protein
LIAEALGARRCILAKDVDGLYTEDPRKNKKAQLIKEITTAELLEADMEDLVIERKLVELLQIATNIKEVYIVNGHIPGNIEKAIEGENPGTIIRS